MNYSQGDELFVNCCTLIDLLENRAVHNPALPLFTFLEDGEREQGSVSAATLAMQARSIAVWLEQLGLSDKRILLIFPQGLEFIASFFGCIYASSIAVPAPMPDPTRVARTLPRLQGILADATPAAVLTNRDGLAMAAEVAAHLPELTKNLKWIAFEDCPPDLASTWHQPAIDPEKVAHLQYTSGSTSTPKGTMITHANILANSLAIQKSCRYTPESRSVVWEPYFHDDGLIQGIIQPIFTGFPCILMAPSALVARPDRWLRAISRYRATHTCGPNFAYELCRRKVTDEQLRDINLSTLVHAQNAAEPVRAETLRTFFERFQVCGLRWNALSPNYGLAEATLMVSSGLRDSGPVILSFDANALEREGLIRQVPDDHPNARLLVSSGRPLFETTVAIVDPQTGVRCADDRVGEILVKSPGVAAGYFERPAESHYTFQARLDSGDGPFMRTGDQGFMLDGDLFITGRIKDLIIIRGENRYPQDIELSVERAHPAIAPGNIAAFSVEVGPEERLAVVAEVKRGTSAPHAEMMDAIRDAIAHDHELRPWAVVLLAPGTLPKTSSGKIQRQASRKAFMEGTLQEVARWKEESRSERSADPMQAPAGGKSAEEIQAWLTRYLAAELGASTNEIGLDVPFNRFGLDSASAVRLAADLGDWLGTKLEPVIAWNYPNILALSRHLQGHDDLPAAILPPQHTVEPIAIIGASCRFPGGVTNLETFWTLLDQGVDAIGDVPRARWDIEAYYDPNPDADGKIVSRSGGFLSDIDRFEPTFFEISPREAAEMDPQQRLLLEVSWEAFENAGQTLAKLRGSNTGVYVGISGNEYQQLGLRESGTITPYLFLGTTHSTGVARLSYWLGLQGPNLPINTACSSSLVAVHLACQALRNGECSMAIAGGVNLLLSPESSVCLSRMHALSPTGRCHSFSVDADGYVRSEGCGMVVLKRLSDAQRDGDPILAVIRGTAVNQDGRTNGLTAPNGPAQEDVIRRALSNASVQPHEIGYVETHGTGTPLGDPIEVKALARVLGQGRNADLPICIGSVKTNIGHAESAAGIAGLLKVVLAISHSRIPSSLHFRRPSPHIPWSELPVRVVAEPLAWTSGEKKRIAGVSSFGMSGTNAHIILEEPPHREEKPFSNTNHYLVPLSAKTPEALHALAKSYGTWLSQTDASLHDIAYTASLRRSHFEHRLSAIVRSKEELSANLDGYTSGHMPSGVVAGKTLGVLPKIVFVFSGQGSQWVGMGRQLYLDEPVFRDAMMACDTALRKETGYSIVDELHKPEDTSRLAKTLVAQPALFAIEVSLATLLQSWGIVPSAVIGHSVGEIAAAHIAGMLDLAQAARLVSLRARIMQRATGQGKMVSAALTEHAVAKTIAGLRDRVGIAAINDPYSVVLSGDIEAIDQLVEELSTQGVALRPLRVDYAFHSPQMEPLAAEFLSALGKLDSKPATIPMMSTVTGEPIPAEDVDAEYWARNIRQTVRFSEAIATAAANGQQLFIEVGPHPVLTISIEQTLAAQNANGSAIPTLRRERDERQQLLLALAGMHTRGCTLEFSALYARAGRVVELPTYSWQRERFWLDASRKRVVAINHFVDHPLLGSMVSVAGTEAVFEVVCDPKSSIWLGDHRIFDETIFPGAAFVEMARAAGAYYFRAEDCRLLELTIQNPMRFSDGAPRRLQVVLSRTNGKGLDVGIHSQPATSLEHEPWLLHARGVLEASAPQTPPFLDLKALQARLVAKWDVVDAYRAFSAMGFDYGPTFRGMAELWKSATEVLTRIELVESVRVECAWYGIHPALLDAAFQSLIGTMNPDGNHAYVPIQFGEFVLFRPKSHAAWAHVRLENQPDSEVLSVSILLADELGRVFASLSNVQFKRTAMVAFRNVPHRQTIAQHLHRIEWQDSTIIEREQLGSETWLLLDADSETPVPIDGRFHSLEARCVRTRLETWLHEESRSAESFARIVWLCDVGIPENSRISPADRAEHLAVEALRLVRVLVRQEKPPQLVIVTRGAVSVEAGESASSAAAAIWGFARTLMLEHPELACKLVDVDPNQDFWESLWRELSCFDSDNQIAWRRSKRFVARLEKLALSSRHSLPDAPNHALAITHRGELSSLHVEATERIHPGPGEIEIKVYASGLNFRDVLTALGMYPGEAGLLGGECAGSVVAIGAGVTSFQEGDRVMAIASGAFRAFVTVDARLAAPIPKRLSIAEGATIPAVFLTAYYALHGLAKLQPGERILIHAAAGGVGMAAIQIARLIGAKIFATASRSKWPVLHAMGVDCVASSRDLDFVQVFRDATHGEGVDVVLNSLAGEFVEASLSLIRPKGRFLEMGKTDIRSPESIAVDFPSVEYRPFDLLQVDPEKIQAMFSAIVRGFDVGELVPLPIRSFALLEAEKAFRFMAEARHVGKIVLVAAPNLTDLTSGTVLVTGGNGALGLLVARRLWERYRVAHLLLVGRNVPSPERVAEIARLRQQGANVTLAQIDVTNPDAVKALVDSIPAQRPLRGIIHATGVIDDGIVLEQTPDRIAKVLAPKVKGAWNIFEAVRNKPLDFFVMFSSVAGILGNAGQISYAAANAFVDSFASRIRSFGIHASSLAWGPWEGEGMATNLSDKDRARLLRVGLAPMRVGDGLALLEEVLRLPDTLVVPMNLDPATLARDEAVPPMLRRLVPTSHRSGPQRHSPAPPTILARIPEAQRREVLLDAIRRNAAEVLGLREPNAIPVDRSLFELGFDSLMAVELRNRLSKGLSIRIDAGAILQTPVPDVLAANLLRTVNFPSIELLPPTIPPPPHSSQRSMLHPLSASQSRLYFLDRVLERRETYNLQIAMRIGGILVPERLQAALEVLIGRHDQLRMHIIDGLDGPKQRILPWVDVPLEVVDLRGHDESDWAQLVRERAAVPFDLTRAPLLRVTLATLDHQYTGLLLVWHHVATDGWSIGRFLQELETLYANSDASLPSVVSYRELVALRKLDDDARTAHRDWWAAYLKGVEPLDLPVDHSPVRRNRRGGNETFLFDVSLSDAIDTLARNVGATPFAVLLTGWATVMHRYCRQDDVTIGVITSGRNVSGAENAIGLFVETIPVCCKVDEAKSVAENITELRQSLLDALAHDSLPLDEILSSVPNLQRGSVGSTPLLRVTFVLEQASWLPPSFAGFRVEPFGDALSGDVEGTNKFDLRLAMVRTEAGYRASIEYAADIFEQATIQRLVGHLRQVLASMAASPENRLSNIDILTTAERHQLVVEWNDTIADYPSHKCIHELFEEQVERAPNAIAVIFGEEELTYRELNHRANQLAHYLRSLGVGPDVLVALCLDRSIEMVVGLLGILKAGGAYVPLDVSYPELRLNFMLDDAAAHVLITQTKFVSKLSKHRGLVVCLDSELNTADRPTLDNPLSNSKPHHLAYVIYTSGSTGNPKGVLLEHRGLVNLALWHCRTYHLQGNDRTTQLASLGFDAATWEIWPSLIAGATIVVVRDELRASPSAVATWLVARGVTMSFMPTPLAEAMVDLAWPSPSDFRVMLTGGDRLQRRPSANASFRLVNHYGPTECTVVATACDVAADVMGSSPLGPPAIGNPIANTLVYVLDQQRQLVPIGVAGELYIGGDGLARGYLNRPELTAERFVRNPFSNEPTARLYKTGDLCRWRTDGNLEFLGRLDHQVKIRGFRIELGEIEVALASHPSVRMCVVLAREDRLRDKRLVAYVESINNECSASALRNHVAALIPDYMIPTAFVFLDSLPVTPNGKIDRKALPAPEFDRAALSTRFVAARTHIEATLQKLWAEALGLDSVGIHDNFFELGGNSLLSIRLISRAAKAGLRLTVSQLFESPTIEGLAKALATNKPTVARCLIPLRAHGAGIPFVLVPGLAGTSMVFLSLRDALHSNVPIWSFDDPYLARHSEQPETIEELVRLWVAELVAGMPEANTFKLGGYSFGGMVAVEMARQLTSLGKHVECVLILDGGLPNDTVPFEPVEFLETLATQLGAPTTTQSKAPHNDIEDVLARVAMAIGTRHESAVDDPFTWARAALVAAENNYRRTMQWQVRPIDVPLIVLRAAQDSSHPPDLGWSNAVGHHVQAVFVPGDHQTMMQAPFVQTLAFCIDGLLAQYDGHAKRRS